MAALTAAALLLAPQGFTPGLQPVAVASSRCAAPQANIFDNLFGGESESVRAAKDQAFEEQQAILARRKNPKANADYLRGVEERRRKDATNFMDKINWQRDTKNDPLIEFKKRQAEDKVKPLGYEDVPKGGIQFPMASFGVGGEFGVGGKYDNGERFDLRLPYVDQGWVEGEGEEVGEKVPFWENLLSGGKLQAEASKREQERRGKGKGRK